eukprot:7269077-Lingulodinium_polyedra.AAC.1
MGAATSPKESQRRTGSMPASDPRPPGKRNLLFAGESCATDFEAEAGTPMTGLSISLTRHRRPCLAAPGAKAHQGYHCPCPGKLPPSRVDIAQREMGARARTATPRGQARPVARP